MPDNSWSPARRLAFRFATAYFVLYLFPFPFNAIPKTEPLFKWWDAAWAVVVKWTGLHVFGVTITVLPNGSGDTTFNYVQLFCALILAAVIAVVWSVLDRKRTSYDVPYHWLRAYIRFGLAGIMISYGAFKVIQAQFPAPSLDRLIQPYGDSSPMGLLWTFMGASAVYNVFAGAGEMLGGLLLTTRRTTALGALVSIAVMSNVVMLNFAYDVPVKLYSAHLLLMAAFLLLPDLRRLANVLVFNRDAAAAELHPQLGERWRRWAPLARTAFVVLLLVPPLMQARQQQQFYAKRSPLRGIWTVEEFAVDGQSHPPLVSDLARWRRVVFDYSGTLSVQLMSDTRVRYALNLDERKRTMTLSRRFVPGKKFAMSYAVPTPGVMTLAGQLEGKKIEAKLRLVPTPSFLLTSRGFHWINELPFNR